MDRSRLIVDFLVAVLMLPVASFAAPRFTGGAWSAARAGLSGTQSSQQAATRKSSGQTPAQSSANTAAPASAESAMHSITLTFDYDFTKTPACSATVKTQCVAKFSVYDISSRKPYFLFYAPIPSGAHGLMKGITATSPQLLFAVGKHRIAVSAQEPDGKESPPHECKTIIEIKAASAADSSTAH